MACPISGAGTAVSFSGILATVALRVRTIDGFREEFEDIERPLLLDPPGSQLKYCRGDRVQHETITVEFEFDPDDFSTELGETIQSSLSLAKGVTTDMTITFQAPPDEDDGATLAGSGYITALEWDELTHEGGPIPGRLEFRFDGDATPYGYTRATSGGGNTMQAPTPVTV